MSIGSLSPQHPVLLSRWLGSSHVCGGGKTHLKDASRTVDCCGSRTCLWNSSVVPDVAFVRKHICYISKIPLLHVLFQWIKQLFGSYLTKDMMQKRLNDRAKRQPKVLLKKTNCRSGCSSVTLADTCSVYVVDGSRDLTPKESFNLDYTSPDILRGPNQIWEGVVCSGCCYTQISR